MLTLPQRFDQNEWFLIVCILITYAIILFLPRRFPLGMTILLMLFGSTVARLSDHFLASPKLDLYNLMDTPNYDLFDLVTYFLYAPFSYLFIYFYDKWNVKGYWNPLYILLCTSAGTMFEWICKVFHLFTYKGWHLSYSFSVYLIIQCLAILFYHLIKQNYYLLVKSR